MAESLRRFFGVYGVAHNERHIAQSVARYFEWIMSFIALCLPFYWYFDSYNELNEATVITFHWLVWGTFVAEFLVMTALVRNKKFYIKTNWLNLIIIIGTFPLLDSFARILSALWLARLLVIVRVLIAWWDRQKAFLAKNHLYYTLIVFASLCLIAGATVSLFDEGIKDPFTGIWWAVQTITTVGYGDVVPKTFLGRCIAVLLMLMGVALITILTANFSAYLLALKQKELQEDGQQEIDIAQLSRQLTEVSKRLETIEKKLDKINVVRRSDSESGKQS